MHGVIQDQGVEYYAPLNYFDLLCDAEDQTKEAEAHLDRDESSLVAWPFASVARLAGSMGPGEVWFVCGISGGGKTTFITSCVEAWAKADRKVYILPLETEPFRFRTHLACLDTGLSAGDALSGALRSQPNYRADRARLIEALHAQTLHPFVDHVCIASTRFIDMAGLISAAKEAYRFNASVVVVDHIDHIASGEYSESKQVNNLALQLAQDYGLLFVFTSQLNLEITAGSDKMSKYQPPLVQFIQYKSAKLFNATGILGLFRPMRHAGVNETDAEYVAAVKSARSGTTEAYLMLEPDCMGVNMMKLRNYGANEGRRCILSLDHGRVSEMPEKDRAETRDGRTRLIY